MIAIVGVDPCGRVLLALLIKTNIELRESQTKRILKDLLKLKMQDNKDANCIDWQQVRLDGLSLLGPNHRG